MNSNKISFASLWSDSILPKVFMLMARQRFAELLVDERVVRPNLGRKLLDTGVPDVDIRWEQVRCGRLKHQANL